MRGVEHTHYRRECVQCFGGRKSSSRFYSEIECVSLDVLHNHVDGAVGGSTKIVNCDCVWMAKTTRGLALAPEPSQPFRVRPHFGRQNFYSHTIAEQNMSRAIDCTH